MCGRHNDLRDELGHKFLTVPGQDEFEVLKERHMTHYFEVRPGGASATGRGRILTWRCEPADGVVVTIPCRGR